MFQGLDAPPDAGAQPDQLDYERLAFHMSAGEGYCLEPGTPTAFRPPGTSLTLLPAYLAFGRSFAAGRVWFALLSTLTVLVAALIGRAAFGDLAGLLGALWLAVYPGHFYYSMHFLSETPFAFWLSLAALGAVLSERRGSLAFALFAGVSLALAALTRPQGLLCAPIAWAAAPVIARGFRKVAWGRLIGGSVAFALVLAPWIARNYSELGHASMSSVGGCTFWGAHNDRMTAHPELAGAWIPVTELVDAEHPMSGDEFQIDAQCWSYGRAWVAENKAAMPGLLWRKLVRSVTPFGGVPSPLAYWAFALSWIVTVPFLLAGLLLAWRANPVAASTALVALLATLATVVVFYGSQRFRDGISSTFAAPIGLALARALRRG